MRQSQYNLEYNPDEYFTDKISGVQNNGICKKSNKEWESCLNMLEQTVQYWIEVNYFMIIM